VKIESGPTIWEGSHKRASPIMKHEANILWYVDHAVKEGEGSYNYYSLRVRERLGLKDLISFKET
jgi:hypothetical protein